MAELLPYFKGTMCEKCGHAPALTEHHAGVNQSAGNHHYHSPSDAQADPVVIKMRSCSKAINGTEWPVTHTRELTGAEIKARATQWGKGAYISPTESYQMWEIPEHLHRICPNCRWEWAEAPLDVSHILGGPRGST